MVTIVAESKEVQTDKMNHQIQTQAMPSDEMIKLLENPNRGFRLETTMNVADRIEPRCNGNAFESLDETLACYAEDYPLITQHYFYLTDYRERDLDERAFQNMQDYFELCRKRGLRVLLRFAYIQNDQRWAEEDAEVEQIARHVIQLEEFIRQNRDIIYGYQAGYLGPWGEWSGGAKQDRFTVLNHILNHIPDDLPVMVRYVWIKNVLEQSDMRRARVGFHDDYVIDRPHQWNTGAKDDSPYYEQLTAESPYFTIDGEMPWAPSAWGSIDCIDGIDGLKVAQRLAKHHFTSFSIEHNYRERDGLHSIHQWKSVPVTPQILKEMGLPFNPNWFADGSGRECNRSCYEYIRDFLGYHLAATAADYEHTQNNLRVRIQLTNYGFSAPHAMKNCDIVLLDKDYRIVARQPACKLYQLQPETPVDCITYFRNIPSGRYFVGIGLWDYADKGARLANRAAFENSCNILSDITL